MSLAIISACCALGELAHGERAAVAWATIRNGCDGGGEREVIGGDGGHGGGFEFERASAFKCELIVQALRVAQSDPPKGLRRGLVQGEQEFSISGEFGELARNGAVEREAL